MVFTGDAIPAPEDIPIYVNKQASLETLDRLASLEAERFCPAWDHAYDRPEARQVITAGKRMILRIDQAVQRWEPSCANLEALVDKVSADLHRDSLGGNPLFRTTVACHCTAPWACR